MSDDRKSVTIKLNEQQNEAIERWMSETLCSRQVSIIGLLVQGAKSLGVWDDAPHARGTHFVRTTINGKRAYGTDNATDTTSADCTDGIGGTDGTSNAGGATSADGSTSVGGTMALNPQGGTCGTSVASATGNRNQYSFSDFWYSMGTSKRGLREEAKRKWNSKRLQVALRESGLTPADVAERYVAYFNSNKDGYSSKYVKHVANWLDAFGFLEDLPSSLESGRLHVDVDLG